MPSVGTLLGTGFELSGKYKADKETGTHLTTLRLFIFKIPIPIFNLAAFRVLDVPFDGERISLNLRSLPELTETVARSCHAKDDKYFIGREPLRKRAIAWNLWIIWVPLVLILLYLLS